jgi:hypothetical protein
MVLSHIITHGIFYGVVVTGYLFLVMITMSPRVWGYQDYPDIVKKKVPAQTRKEKTLAAIVGVPWFLFVLGFPVYSTYLLKSNLGGEIPFVIAFLNVFVMFLFVTLGDLVLLDWLLISKITPKFVIIPGSAKEDYKDFSHHYKAHARATLPITLLCLLIAAIVSFF